MTMQKIIEALKQETRDSCPGISGERRAKELESFLNKTLSQYAEKLNLSQEEILNALEKERDYSATDYYQKCNFPDLSEVDVYESSDKLKKAIPSLEFRCSSCHSVTRDPYSCHCGTHLHQYKDITNTTCNWKTFGLFVTSKIGYRFIIKEDFLNKPYVDEIFMPLEFETTCI